MILPTREDCAYAAGVMDSDGSLNMTRGSLRGKFHQFIVNCRLSQNNDASIRFLQDRWGGKSYLYERPDGTWRHRKPMYTWALSAKQTDRFLADITPYIVLKKEQLKFCKVARSFMSRKCVSSWSIPGMHDLYRDIQLRISVLNGPSGLKPIARLSP